MARSTSANRPTAHEAQWLRPIRLHHILGGAVRPTELGPLRRGEGRDTRTRQRHRHRRRRARDPRQLRASVRLLPHGVRDHRRRETTSSPIRASSTPSSPSWWFRSCVYLASNACEITHHNFSACAGRFARVFVGLGDGWVADPDRHPTAEDIAEHLAQISASDPYSIPTSIFDEVFNVCAQLGIG